MGKIPVGLQLYTLRDETEKDFIGTLERVAELGYETVEFAGYGGIPAEEMKAALDRLGLRAVSSHVGLERVEADLEGEIAYLKTLGAIYLIFPWIESEKLQDAADVDRLAEVLRRTGERCNQNGLAFLYHNHDFEFRKVEGEYILDRLFRLVGTDRMKAELDLYWVTKAGLDPAEYLRKYAGNIPIVHVKDMTGDEERFFAEVGSGVIDYKTLLKKAEETGVGYFMVEQDLCRRPPLESVKMSIEYLKSVGIA